MSDSHQILKCPACQKDMTKIFLNEENFNIDICIDGCGGMWLDNRELKFVDEQDENIDEIIEAIEGKTFEPTDESANRTCPACGAKMVKNFSSIKKEIQIDECYSCGGKFLDNSELQKFRQEYATEKDRSDATVNFMYATVGSELRQLDELNQALANSRSSMKRLFDRIIY